MDRRTHLSLALALLILVIADAFAPVVRSQSPLDADEQVVRAAGIATDTATLLQLLGQRTLQDKDRKALDRWVALLDSEAYADRRQANDELLRRGPLALPFLSAALANAPSAELRRRAADLVRKIEATAGNEVMASAVRLLVARQAEGALDALLRYLPNIADAWLEEDVLASLGRLAIRQGQPDPKLLAALQDPVPARRAGAVYVLGRRASVEQRARVRSFLADRDPLVRRRAAEGLIGKPIFQALSDIGAADEVVLKTHSIAPTESGLREFLHKQTPDGAGQARLATLVGALGALEYADRYFAADALVKAGTPALAFLRPALLNPDAEVARRAQRCIEEIRRAAGPALPAAVVRRLAAPDLVKAVPATLQALVSFVPFAEDESVEDDVHKALAVLSLRQEKVDPALVAALGDALPARRAAAAYVLGAVGTATEVGAVRKLLADPAVGVRLHAAQGLLAARDREAVPKLIALLGELPPSDVWRIEETLVRLAGDDAPPLVGVHTASGRQKMVKAWQAWWQERQGTIDLARAFEGDPFLGLVTVCEYDAGAPARNNTGGQAWEAPRNGTPRFKVDKLAGAMDAQVLPNGRMLVAENGAHRVTERDRGGNVQWEYVVQGGNPICCQRLPNGNTFIALYQQLIEVRPDKSEVYRYSPGPQFYIFSARKTRTGTVVCMTAQGALVEVDPLQNKTIRTINLGPPAGGWAGVEPLANGHFLVATMNNGMVREVDDKGAVVWSVNSIPGVFRASRLPNGNTLVISMTTREVAEIDRAGAVRWRHACEGRPWSVHWR